MMKIPFDIKYKSDIIAGNALVVTDCGEHVEILKWDCKGTFPILAIIDDGDTHDSCFFGKDGKSPNKTENLYLMFNWRELTTFEEAIGMAITDYIINNKDGFSERDAAIKHSPRILNIAREEIRNELPMWKHICSPQSYTDDSIFIEGNSLRWGNRVISLDDLKKLPKEK